MAVHHRMDRGAYRGGQWVKMGRGGVVATTGCGA